MDAATRTRLRFERSRIVRERTESSFEIDFEKEVEAAMEYHRRRREGQRRAHAARKLKARSALVVA